MRPLTRISSGNRECDLGEGALPPRALRAPRSIFEAKKHAAQKWMPVLSHSACFINQTCRSKVGTGYEL